jgi:ankyrin repeat protein
MLLRAGSDVNIRDAFGSTALHWAAQRGNEKLVRLLLSKRAEVNVQDEFGETALIWAAMCGDKAVVKVLLAAGARNDFKPLQIGFLRSRRYCRSCRD